MSRTRKRKSLIDSIAELIRPHVRGWLGETSVNLRLKLLLPEEYQVVNNVILPTETGTTQIDHIVVSPYGIFVIETKNYKGWIYGNDQSREWTQTLYKNKYKFMNPIHQNYAHVKAIESRLSNYPNIPIIPIIAFSKDCRLKVKTRQNVVYFNQVKSVIRKFKSKVMSIQEMMEILALLQHGNEQFSISSKEHIENVNYKKTLIKYASAGDKCPRCNTGFLSVKQGKHGKFLGCGNYPKCRFTKQLANRVDGQ
ncbi:MAG TPA: NERD domain-containing protein [Clostridiaceae bacterium]|jgi:hypothetical protein|nr:NERD domain-containing protein [Clostridiaceae bacterium]HOA30626.1 NERD domain-containing protein [Clostridia bacterium]